MNVDSIIVAAQRADAAQVEQLGDIAAGLAQALEMGATLVAAYWSGPSRALVLRLAFNDPRAAMRWADAEWGDVETEECTRTRGGSVEVRGCDVEHLTYELLIR